MAQTLREKMARHDDARSLLRAIYRTEIDLLPNPPQKTLTVRVYPFANDSSDEACAICALSPTPPLFPGTDLRLIYELVSSQNVRDQ
ncbi:MAG: putative transposase [Gammaproteobacteria bacterium]